MAKSGWTTKPTPAPDVASKLISLPNLSPEDLLRGRAERLRKDARSRPTWIEDSFKSLRDDIGSRQDIFSGFVSLSEKVLGDLYRLLDDPYDVDDLKGVIALALAQKQLRSSVSH